MNNGEILYIKSDSIEQALKLYQLSDQLGIGTCYKLIEPRFIKELHEVPMVTSDYSMLPFKVNFAHNVNIPTNAPSTHLSKDKCVRNFMVFTKPQFTTLSLHVGCGSTFCDSIHQNKGSACPSLSGSSSKLKILKATLNCPGYDNITGTITSRALAEFFIDKATLDSQVINMTGFYEFVDGVMEMCQDQSFLVAGWSKVVYDDDAEGSHRSVIHITRVQCVQQNLVFEKFTGGVMDEPPLDAVDEMECL